MPDYSEFLNRRSQIGTASGFDPLWMPDFLFDFQRSLVEWSLRKGRSAIFADCGLGKTPMQLVWAENVVRKTNKPVLIATPLAVSAQTVREAEKFGIEAKQSRDGTVSAKITVTNYERLHYFDHSQFAGVVCDESSGIKHFSAKRTGAVIDFMRTVPYRLLCTATAAPNDYIELGTSSEALGELGFQDMIGRFFIQAIKQDHRGWNRTKYVLRSHAVEAFWRWVCSWARALRKPSDLGFDDTRFILPPLTTAEHCIKATKKQPGRLFDVPAVTLEDQREERRRTIPDRCEKVAGLVNGTGRPAIAWCHLNDEGDLLEKLIPDAVQISGADSDERKEEAYLAFVDGKIRVLVTKPILAGWGLNFQHCSHETFFPSHSFEQFYQGVRRCWRFGQKNRVHVDVVTSEGEVGVLANLNRKAEAADKMFERLVELMHDHLSIRRADPFIKNAETPSWLGISSADVTRNGSGKNKLNTVHAAVIE